MGNNISEDNLQKYLQNQINQITVASATLEQKTQQTEAKKLEDAVEQLKSLFKQ